MLRFPLFFIFLSLGIVLPSEASSQFTTRPFVNEDAYTIDGRTDCSRGDVYECTTLSQALESIQARYDTVSVTAPDTEYTIYVSTTIVDTTERQPVVNQSLNIYQKGTAGAITISNDTTSAFLTLGAQTTVSDITISIVSLNFNVNATHERMITGHVFIVPSTMNPDCHATLSLQSLSIVGSNGQNTPVYSTVSFFSMGTGTLKLSKVTVSDITVTTESLIMTSGQIYTENICKFVNIASEYSTDDTIGGVISCTVNEESEIEILGTHFTNCRAAHSGGAINIFVNKASTSPIKVGGMHYNEEVRFKGCTAQERGGAFYLNEKDNLLVHFNRIDYLDCKAYLKSATTITEEDGPYCGNNVYFVTTAIAEPLYYLDEIEKILAGQTPTGHDYVASFLPSASATTPVEYPLAKLRELFGCTIDLLATNNGAVCDTTELTDREIAQVFNINPGRKGSCQSLEGAFKLTDQSQLPIGNQIHLYKESNMQPSNFSATAHRSVIVFGNGNTVKLKLTHLLTGPLVSVGPGLGYVGDDNDRVIMLIIKDTTFDIQRTEAIYLRQNLFQINNGYRLYNADNTSYTEKRSNSLHYLELSNVIIMSGLDFDHDKNMVPLAATAVTLFNCAEGSTLLLRHVQIKNMMMLGHGDQSPSLIDTKGSTLVLVNCHFENITTSNASLLSIDTSPGAFGMEMPNTVDEPTLQACNVFRGITRTYGSGAVFNVALSKSESGSDLAPYLPLTFAYFTVIHATDGNGAAVYISSLDSPDQVYWESVLFSGCAAQKGNRAYVVTDSVTAEEIANSWKAVNENTVLNNDYQARIGLSADSVDIFDHVSYDWLVMVDVNRGVDAGNENGECGLPATIPCKSIYMAYSHRTDVTTLVSMASGDYPADKRPITFLSSITVNGEAPSNTYVTKKAANVDGGVFVVSDLLQQGTVTFQTISFLILSEIFREGETEGFERPLVSPIFVSKFPGTYQFIDLSFQMGDLSSPIFQYDVIGAAILQAAAGNIVMKDCTFESLYFGPGSEVFDTSLGAILTLAGTTFNNITLDTRPLFWLSDIATDLSLELGSKNQRNSFTNVHRMSGDGAVFDVQVGDIYGIVVQNADFVNCTSDERATAIRGGGSLAVAGTIHATLTDRNGTFYIDPSSVTFSLVESLPYFDAVYNAPWKSAVTFSAEDVKFSWLNTTSLSDVIRTVFNEGTYIANLSKFTPTWDSADYDTMYYVYVMAGSQVSFNNTLYYAYHNHVDSTVSTVAQHVAIVDPTGGDVPGCGEPSNPDSIPCYTISQAFVNLNPSSMTHFINLTQGHHETDTSEYTYLTTSVTVAGYITRGLLKTTLYHDSPAFFTSSPTDPVRISDLIIQTTSGSFLVNTGAGGAQLETMTIRGLTKATPEQRLRTPFFTSTVGPITLSYLTVSTITLLNTTLTRIAGGKLTVQHCSFSNILGHSPGTGGSALAFTMSTIAPLYVNNVTFTTCHTQTNGGAISIAIASSSTIELHKCTFINNSAIGNGGSVYISGTQKWTAIVIDDVTFDGNLREDPEATATYGAYVYYESLNPNADISGSDISIFLDYRLIDNQFCANITTNPEPVNFYELEHLLYIGGDNSSSVDADPTCGSINAPCDTLDSASRSTLAAACQCLWIRPVVIPASNRPVEIPKNFTIVGHSDDETGLTTIIHLSTVALYANNTPIIYHDLDDQTAADTIPPCIRLYNPDDSGDSIVLLRITNVVFRANSSAASGYSIRNRMIRCQENTKLMLDTCTFTSLDGEDRMVTLYRSILWAAACRELKLYDVLFTNITLKNAPLINIPSTMGNHFEVVTLSTFQYITREEGDGSVVEETLTEHSDLSFNNVVFINCTTKQGNGGALAIIYQSGKLTMGDTEDPDTGAYRTTQFFNCSARNGDGGAIFFDFEQANEPPGITPTDPAYFIVQNVDVDGPTGAAKHGYYFCAHGKSGVVDEITLWKALIRKTNETGWYQFKTIDKANAKDEEDKYSDVFKSVPSSISVVLTELAEETDHDKPKCQKCSTIPLALKTYADFAPSISLEFEERDAPAFNIAIDHSVVITGTNTKLIIPITHESQDCFLNVLTKRIEFGITRITFEMDTTRNQYAYPVRVVKVTEYSDLNLHTLTFVGAGENPLNVSLIEATAGKLTIESCTFALLQVRDFPLLKVPTQAKCFYMTGGNLFNTITTDPSVSYDQGTLFSVTLEEGTGLLIENANFTSCRAATNGALFYFEILDEPDMGTFNFSNIYFKEVENSNAPVTTYCKVVSTLTEYVEKSGEIWTALFNHQDYDPEAFLWYSDLPTPQTLKDYRYYNFYCSVDSTVDDPTQCEEETPCRYFHYASDLANKALVEQSYIHIAKGVLNTDDMKASVLRSVQVSGYVSDAGIETVLEYVREGTGSVAIVCVGIGARRMEPVDAEFVNFSVLVKSTIQETIYVPLFGVVSQFGLTARLILNTITFTLDTDIGFTKHAGLLNPIVYALNGVLRLKDTTFSNLIIQNDPLLAVTPRVRNEDGTIPETKMYDIEFEGRNVFNNITRNEGNGTIFCLNLANYSDFYLEKCSFDKNTASYGACIYISVYENVTDANYDWDPDTITFNLPGTYDDGAYVYLHIENLLYVSDEYRERMRKLVSRETDVQSYFVAEVRAGEFQDIYQFFEFHLNALIVSLEPSDFNILREAIYAFNADPTATRIFLKRHLDSPPLTMTLSRNLAISGIFADRSRAYIPIDGLSEVLYTVTGTLKLVKISINTVAFHMKSTPDKPILQPLFLTDGEYATLFLSSTSFESVDGALEVPLDVPLINCIQGTLGLSKIEMKNLQLYTKPLISLPDDLDNFGVFALSEFTNITRRSGSGAVIHQSVEAGDILTLKNLIFTNCVAENGNGGAVDLIVRLNGGFTCQNVRFINCTATGTPPATDASERANSDTKGGGMNVDIDGIPTSFTFSKTSMSGNSASLGKAIYIDMTSIEAFSVEQWTLIMDSMTGVTEGDILAHITVTDKTTGVNSTSHLDLLPYLPKEESTTETQTSSEKTGVATWIIVLIVVLAVVVAVIVIVVFICCKRRSSA